MIPIRVNTAPTEVLRSSVVINPLDTKVPPAVVKPCLNSDCKISFILKYLSFFC